MVQIWSFTLFNSNNHNMWRTQTCIYCSTCFLTRCYNRTVNPSNTDVTALAQHLSWTEIWKQIFRKQFQQLKQDGTASLILQASDLANLHLALSQRKDLNFVTDQIFNYTRTRYSQWHQVYSVWLTVRELREWSFRLLRGLRTANLQGFSSRCANGNG